MVTLGVHDFAAEREFYRRLGWSQAFDSDDFAVFELRGALLALFPVDKLAADARAGADQSGHGIRSNVIINVEEPEEVDELVERARRAGAIVTKPPVQAEFFEGRDAYFTDPEGHYWEVAWAPSDNPVVVAARRAAGLTGTNGAAEKAFVYTVYIKATPERVWQGLTDPDLTRQYWRHHSAGPKTFHSDWKKGSTYEMAHEEIGLVVRGPDQIIVESDPPHRLAFKWHTVTPEWAAAVGMDEATAEVWRSEPRSTVAFDLEDVGHGVVKLTVTHDGFPPGSAVLRAISDGWPAVVSSLKTLLETGSSLRTA